jgi:hypothetical protein
MPHPEWNEMSAERKMEFLYNWCFQMSDVVQELRSTTQTLMDKVILVEALLAERKVPSSGEVGGGGGLE